MRTILNKRSKTILSLKLIAFSSWFIYIVVAIANNLLIEAFLLSIAFVVITYIIFGHKRQTKQELKLTDADNQESKPTTDNNNYLSVFFYNAS